MNQNMNSSSKFNCNTAAGHVDDSNQSLLQQVPYILETQHIKCIHHTPESAQKLHETYGFFANGREMSHEVEQYLFDAFIDDDYDGLLHLSTLHSYPEYQPDMDNDSMNIGPPMGLVFWREVPDEEMKEWFDWNRVRKALANSYNSNSNSRDHSFLEGTDRKEDEDIITSSSISPTKKRKWHFVRQNSVESIQNMIESLHLSSSKLKEHENNAAEQELVHAWIKLELIAVRERYWGRHLGSLLLACALYNAHDQFDQSRVVLHIAGGEENIPAVKLYERFGFLPIRQGTVFHKPDKYMYVLGDIRYALGHTMWKGKKIEPVAISEQEEEHVI
mmetsp:Transcript_15417/g.29068  ORF Transcript_15417/g.29068 Transcript_15417/m.29068 type:complete len:332 (-) Transcript_15417:140-1135(-)